MSKVVYGDSLAEGLASRIGALRSETWIEVSIGTLETLRPDGGALGPGANNFKTRVHDLYYVPGARNLVTNASILHGDANDTFDTAEQIYARARQLTLWQRALGWEVCWLGIPGTLEYNNPASSPYRRPQRQAINEYLRNGGNGWAARASGNWFADPELVNGLGQVSPGNGMLSGDVHLSTPTGKNAVSALISNAIPLEIAMSTASKRLVGPQACATSATTVYTVPGATQAIIRRIHVSNPTGGALPFTLSIGVSAAGTRLWDAYSIPANSVYDVYGPFTLEAAEVIQAFSSSANLVLEIDGQLIT